MSKRNVFIDPSDKPFTTAMSLADICNGIECVSQGQFPAEQVISMASHIFSAHTQDESWTDAGTLLQVIEADDSSVPDGMVH